jgi:glutamate-1-semialdehyde 2,1-aminomutase
MAVEQRVNSREGSADIWGQLEPRSSQESLMSAIIATQNRTISREWFARAQKSLVEGVNSPSRGVAVYQSGPVVLERGRGSHVWDADGNEYVDFMMSFGSLIHGHAHPRLVEVVSRAISDGSHFAAATPAEVEAAERFLQMVPSAEVVRFANTGSEANMLALRLARAHTRRTKFLKFEGHYHGWYDPYLLNSHSHPPEVLGPPNSPRKIPDSAGISSSTFDDVLLAPWNDIAALERVMREHGQELACVIGEPIMANMGCILPRSGYLKRLRELTQEHGVLLIFDEVVTGFRYSPGGCQEFYGIRPDISTFGKALGAGFPIGAVSGPRKILDRLRWGADMVLHYGTFNGHRLTMKVVVANLDLLSGENTYDQLNAMGNTAIAGLREIFSRRKIQAIVQGFGPMFQVYFTVREAINDYRDYCTYVDLDRYSRFIQLLLERGIYMTPANGLHWIISTAHTKADIAALLCAAEDACGELR